MNPTRVADVVLPSSVEELASIVGASERPISIGGGRHAMGGQQFGEGTTHLDVREMRRVVEMDAERGLVRAQGGVQWPELIAEIRRLNPPGQAQWGIRQKQTGASDLTLGGALSANAHGRGLTMPPIVGDVESFTLVGPDGGVRACSRTEDAELFALAIGGYGLFGVIGEVTLRLSPRRKVQRVVDVVMLDEIMPRLDEEIARGTIYGDFQFSIDHESPDFLRKGVFSRYRPVDDATPIPDGQRKFTPELWMKLLRLARTDKSAAFREYASYYRSTAGQVYYTDTHQLSTYVPGYQDMLQDLPEEAQGSEIITEVYVPRDRLVAFLGAAGEALRGASSPVTYGTVRLIEPDRETFLPWARGAFACIVFNLLTPHTPAGVARSAAGFRALIDTALGLGGSYFLTYHAFATRDQLLAAHPRVEAFVARKREHDPGGRFQSEWWRGLVRTLEAG